MNDLKLLAPLLLAAAAWGQTANIPGIKIKDSGFDARTKTVSLTFINDKVANITAYSYCFTVLSTDPNQTREQCRLIDVLTTILEMQAARKERPSLPEITFGPSQSVVHPGEERRIEERIVYNDTIFGGSIHIDAVAWSDGTVAGSEQSIIAERTAELHEREFVSKTIKNALSDSQEPAVTSVIAALQQEQQEASKDGCLGCEEKRTHVLREAILALHQPKRHLGDTKEFVPDNQREFLEQLLARHDSLSKEHAKHVSLRKGNQQ